MKKHHFIIIIFCLLLFSCSLPPKYTGDKYPPTKSVDIYYSTTEVTRHYKIVGHLSSHKYQKSIVEKNLHDYAKRMGGDAIIISGDDADVLKYDK